MSVSVDIGGDATCGEGEMGGRYYSLTADVTTDPPGVTYDVAVDWGDGTPPSLFEYNSDPQIVLNHVYVDGPDVAYTIVATVTATYEAPDPQDPNSSITVTETGGDTHTVTVQNVAPTFELSGQSELGYDGEAYQLSVNDFFDPGQDTVSQWQIDWGDGTSGTYLGNPGQFDHLYTENGTYTVTATAFDEDGSYTRTADVTFVSKIKSMVAKNAIGDDVAAIRDGRAVILITGYDALNGGGEAIDMTQVRLKATGGVVNKAGAAVNGIRLTQTRFAGGVTKQRVELEGWPAGAGEYTVTFELVSNPNITCKITVKN